MGGEGEDEGEQKKKSRSNKPDSHGEEVWKWRFGGEKSHSGAGLYVLVILSPLFLSVLCLGYLQSPIFKKKIFQAKNRLMQTIVSVYDIFQQSPKPHFWSTMK